MTLMNITFGDEESSSDNPHPVVPPNQLSCSGLTRPIPKQKITQEKSIQTIYSKSDFTPKTKIPLSYSKVSNQIQITKETKQEMLINSYDYDDEYDYEYNDETESESSSFILVKNSKIRPLQFNLLKRFPNQSNRPQSQQNYPQKQNSNYFADIPKTSEPQSDNSNNILNNDVQKIINNSSNLKVDSNLNNTNIIINPFIDITNSSSNFNPFIYNKNNDINKYSTTDDINICKSTNNNIVYFNNKKKQNTDSMKELSKRPAKFILNDLIKYRLTRSRKVSLQGKIINYQLYKDDTPLLHTRISKLRSNGICYIYEGDHLRNKNEKHIGAILFANGRTTFSVRKNSEYGQEIMTILYKPGSHGAPRQMTIFFPNIQKDIPQNLYNKLAILDESFNWAIDTKGKFSIKSIKNCIIVNKRNREFASVLKIEKETLEIEAKNVFSQLMIFAIGLSSFLCKL